MGKGTIISEQIFEVRVPFSVFTPLKYTPLSIENTVAIMIKCW